MEDDERCCGTGTGTCIINAEGLCWCGQQWNGTAMCRPPLDALSDAAPGSALGSAGGWADAGSGSGDTP
ncbi:hypothetical protein [Rhodoferax sp. OV413]|uniref:hypothetical protein n=1 Tax=Rhodoferax sp. OV413 TaxID=1855285 RepID=UPI0025D22253|nr:hypothetical protein [Rhodoferax sp. OV413]